MQAEMNPNVPETEGDADPDAVDEDNPNQSDVIRRRHRRQGSDFQNALDSAMDAFDGAKDLAEQLYHDGKDWMATHFQQLPEWMRDNDFLHNWHRPPLPNISTCFRSIFRIHTETGNIWSHMLGCFSFMIVAAYFLTRPSHEVQSQEKLVYSAFFLGAIICLAFSTVFHTVSCHQSQFVARLFSRLDYCGISLLIVGSFIPWLFYCFYCRPGVKIFYMSLIIVFGTVVVIVSMWEKFSEPKYRPLRAGLFIGMGCSGVIPTIHYFITDGFWSGIYEAGMGWLFLMAILYIAGALLYAARIPERFFPGKCDLLFQSHQIFHICVVAAAFVHYHGINQIATNRLTSGSCEEVLAEQFKL